ncbi:DUF7079 family protein [Reyranella soli]|uniref:DUF7079 family protein n=1 Tax=Reyranella soli TaxID=1230389 RepID=UPI0011BE8326|nr:hypothetical protein [Reyranella soli]
MLSQSDIDRRSPVWHGLSQLFLDTELQRQDYESIAGPLRASGYSMQELHRILKDEVAPALAPNLASAAGEWAGWSENTVRDLVVRSLQKRDVLIWRILPMRWVDRRHVEAEWNKLAPLLVG